MDSVIEAYFMNGATRDDEADNVKNRAQQIICPFCKTLNKLPNYISIQESIFCGNCSQILSIEQAVQEPHSSTNSSHSGHLTVSLASIHNGCVYCPACNSKQVLSKNNIVYCFFKCTECKSEVSITYNPNETDKQSSQDDAWSDFQRSDNDQSSSNTSQSSVIFRPLAQQSVAENIIRGLIAATVLGFILRGCA